MYPRYVLGVALVVLLAGCAGLPGASDPETTVALTVQNDGATAIDLTITVTDPEGASERVASEQLSSGVGQTFDLRLEGPGTHEIVVAGEDWAGTFTVDPERCAAYEGTLRVTNEAVERANECVEPR
jgi:hypothetical protein